MRFSTMCFAVLAGCGAPGQVSSDAGTPLEVTRVDAGCAITVERWEAALGYHVDVGTQISWPSNPPSSGPHYPVWAAYQEFTSPVPRPYYVHDLEHGAVVLLSNCGRASGDCTPIFEALRAASASLPDDPLCSGSVRVRTVITPDPLIEQPLVAVSWGFIYRAACVDQPSLNDFVQTHYAHGTENLCANGVTSF